METKKIVNPTIYMWAYKKGSSQEQNPQKSNTPTKIKCLVPHQGGLSAVDQAIIHKYQDNIQKTDGLPWKQSIKNLNNIINQNPVLRYNWQYGISLCRNLEGKNSKRVLDIINAALYTPPAFDTSDLVGFPINAILIQFMQLQNGRTFFSVDKVNEAFKEILNQYGEMIKTPLSLTYMNDQEPKGWLCPTAHKSIKYQQYQQYNPQLSNFGFKNWNQWFLRHFKAGKRPIGAGTPLNINSQDVIVHACESIPLSTPCQPVTNVKASDPFWLKDNKYSLNDMFGDIGVKKGYSNLFIGGTVYQAFLSALLYHHWHSPIEGQIVDIYSIPGTYFLDQSQILGYFDPGSPNDSQTFIAATAARMVMVIKAKNKRIGYVAVIFIGMAEVSSCVASKSIGDFVAKGDHIGNFAYGGSSHVVIFQKQAKLIFSNGFYEEIDNSRKGKIQRLSSYFAHIQ